jgi:hypothetical protein
MPLRPKSKKRRELVVVIVTALAFIGAAPAAADTVPSSDSTVTQQVTPAEASDGLSLVAGRSSQMTVPQDCSTVRTHLASYAGRSRAVGCLTPSTPSASAKAGTHAEINSVRAQAGAVSPQGGEATPCDSLAAGQWWYNRTLACIHGETSTFTEYDAKDGAVLGTAVLSVNQVIEPDPASTAWTEEVSLTMTEAEGQVTILEASLVDTCSSPCTTSGTDVFAGADEVTEGETLYGTVEFEDVPEVGTQNLVTGTNVLTVLQPGTVPIDSEATWTDGLQVRCDDALSSDTIEGSDDGDSLVRPAVIDPVDGPAGCVYASSIPTLAFSLATYRGSAALILWTQQYMTTKWGAASSSSPMHRYAGRARQRANRRVICEDSSWATTATVTDDSCDEFPFAASMESGALHGYTGAQCAEITPVQNATTGSWSVQHNKTITYAEGCVRAHVTRGDNTNLGGQLGRYTTSYRVLDGDPYYVQIVT